jgi:hypothetical protein
VGRKNGAAAAAAAVAAAAVLPVVRAEAVVQRVAVDAAELRRGTVDGVSAWPRTELPVASAFPPPRADTEARSGVVRSGTVELCRRRVATATIGGGGIDDGVTPASRGANVDGAFSTAAALRFGGLTVTSGDASAARAGRGRGDASRGISTS